MALPNICYTDENMRAPCLHCTTETGRFPGCHSKCDKYKEYRTAMDEKNAKVRKEKDDCYKPPTTRSKRTKKLRMKGAKHGEV